MIPFDLFAVSNGHELGVNNIASPLNISYPRPKPETAKKVKCLQRSNGLAGEQVVQDAVGLRPRVLLVLVGVHNAGRGRADGATRPIKG